MASSGRHLQSTLYTLLPLHVGKVKVEGVLLFVEFLAGIDDRWLITLCAVEETDDISQTLHPKNLELVHDGCFTGILLRHDESFELLLTGKHSHEQSAADRFQTAVESQFAYHHIFSQTTVADFPMGSEDTDGEGQVVAAPFLADIGG